MAQRLQDRPAAKQAKSDKRSRNIIKGIVALYLGLRSLGLGVNDLFFRRFHPVMLIPFVMGIALFALGIYLLAGKGRVKSQSSAPRKRKDREESFAPSRPTASPSFSFRGNDHQHIVPTGLSVERQLEQLETLRGAGLYTKEEYLVKKRQILGQG